MRAISSSQELFFTRQGLGDDPDWSLPNASEPPDERIVFVGWRLGSAASDLQAHAVMFFVTFRDQHDNEVSGTFKAVALFRSDASMSATSPQARPSWKKIGEVGADDPPHDSSEGLRLDLGGAGALTLRLHSIVAPGAAKVFVTAQQWGVG